MRDLRSWYESRLGTQQKKEGGRGRGGGAEGWTDRSTTSAYAPISDRKRDYETGDWEEKGKQKKYYTISTRPHNRKQLQKTVKLLLLHISNGPSFSSHLLLLSHHHYDYCSDFVFQLLGAAVVPPDHHPALTFLVTIQYYMGIRAPIECVLATLPHPQGRSGQRPWRWLLYCISKIWCSNPTSCILQVTNRSFPN